MNGKQTAIVFVVVTIVLTLVSECSRRQATTSLPTTVRSINEGLQ